MSTPSQPAPTHHAHNPSDPLPTNTGLTTDPTSESTAQADAASRTTGEHSAFTEQRPLDIQPTPEDDVSQGGKAEGKASMTDKVVGKTEKVIGKAMKDPALHTKGELREGGGKAAATGEARVPQD